MKGVIFLDYSNGLFNTNQVIELIKSLKGDKNIEKIDLSNNKIYKDAAEVIGKYINSRDSLINLNINNNHIGSRGIQNIIEGINHNDNFRVLKAKNNDIIDICEIRSHVKLSHLNLSLNKLSCSSLRSISIFLKGNCTIQKLILNSVTDHPKDMIALFDALCCNRSLRSLEIRDNPIDENSMLSLSRAIRINDTLEFLDISNCEITEIHTLTEALSTNNTLNTLIMGYNNIGNDGAIDISRALVKNRSLRKIDLKDNGIYNSGAVAFSIALEVNKTLKEIDFSQNNISDKGVIELMKSGDKLKLLNLTKNSIGKTGVQSLIGARKRRIHCQLLESITTMPVELIDLILDYRDGEEMDPLIYNIDNLKY